MTEQRLFQIRGLFEATLERDPSARLEFLEQACLGDAELLGEVRTLISTHEQTGGLLDRSLSPLRMEGRRIGSYRIGREIGRGGMGIVYLALRADGAFQRQFALKILQSSLASDELVVRFRREREILGSLDHPNIARLNDAGVTDEALPYYVMEYIEGQSINTYCDEHRLNTTQRINLFRTVCGAVQYAHQNLIVHRDLKPSNILVTASGMVKLLDFGIAKFLDDRRQQTIFAATQTGLRLMTPKYASPEQIKGEPITTATDVYALGVILYELLTGHRPYRLKNGLLHEVERAICEEAPTRPSTVIVRDDQAVSLPSTADELSAVREGTTAKLRRRLSGDIDNIVLMALRKEPGRRYPSAEQFDADLRRHLDSLPVIARNDTALYRTQKFLQRHKLPVAAAAALLLLLLGGFVTTVQLYLSAKNAQASAVQAAAEARARQLAAQSEYLYSHPGRLTLGSLLGIESVRRVPLAENRSLLASALALSGHPRAILDHQDWVRSVAISPDGKWLATASNDKAAHLWDARTGRERTRLQHQGSVNALTISPDGAWLATASNDKAAHIWDIHTGHERVRLMHQASVNAVAFSPDGTWLATASNDKAAHIWDIHTGRERAHLEHVSVVWGVAISLDGKWLATASNDNTARLWDAQTGRERARFEHEASVNAVAISPDSTWLATASNDRTARLWDARTGREGVRLELQDLANAVAISPDGRWLATTSCDRTARLWDARTGRERIRLMHQDCGRAVAISPDGTWLATASNDKTARIWDARTGRERARLQHQDWVRSVVISPDGTWLATASIDKTARIWDARTGREQARLELQDSIRAVAISPDGQWLATASHDSAVRIWDVQTKHEFLRMQFDANPEAITFTRNGHLLVSHGASLTFEPWRTEDLVYDLCARLNRNLTYGEWKQYIGNEPYRQTCPNLPAASSPNKARAE